MSGSELAAVLLGVAVLLVLVGVGFYLSRRRRRTSMLQDRYGPEYDRAVESEGRRSDAERVLSDRLERRERLDVRPLSVTAREGYLADWARCQSRFVDDPVAAVREADSLLDRVLAERGYPVDDFESKADMVAVDHPEVVHHYRGAHEVTDRGGAGQATTEELREAFVHYRSLFDRLLEGSSGDDGSLDRPVSPPKSAPSDRDASGDERSHPAAGSAGGDVVSRERLVREPLDSDRPDADVYPDESRSRSDVPRS